MMAESNNRYRLSKLITDGGTYFAKELLKVELVNAKYKNLKEFLDEAETKRKVDSLSKEKNLHQPQMKLLYPPSGTLNIDKFDITLLCCILTNCFNLSKNKKKAIKQLRKIRDDFYAHIAKYELDNSNFKVKWLELASLLETKSKSDLSPHCVKNITDMIRNIECEILTPEEAEKFLRELNKQIEDHLHEMGGDIAEVNTQLGVMKSELDVMAKTNAKSKDIAEVNTQLGVMKSELDVMAKTNAKSEDIAEVNTQLGVMKSELDVMAKTNAKSEDIAEVNTQLGVMKSKLDVMAKTNAKSEDIAEVNTQLGVMKSELDVMAKTNSKSEDIAEMSRQLGVMNTKLDVMAKTNAKSEDIAEMSRQLGVMYTKLDVMAKTNAKSEDIAEVITLLHDINTKLDVKADTNTSGYLHFNRAQYFPSIPGNYMYTQVFKFGAVSGWTRGVFDTIGPNVSTLECTLEDGGINWILEIEGYPFATYGDSGAIVVLPYAGDANDLRVVGILTGQMNTGQYLVSPIGPILESFPGLKKFTSEPMIVD